MSNEMVIHQPAPAPAPMIPYGDMERMAAVIAQSGLFGVQHPTQALALMLIAQAEGLHPATAARDYHVIQGRPALKTDAMLARFQAAGGRVQWHEYSDVVVAATFSHPAGGAVRIDWDMARAKAAGLAGKDVWRQYPRAMLRARVISEGIRTVYPGVLSGMYTPEEIRDMTPPKAPVVETVTVPSNALDVADYDATIEKFNDASSLREWLIRERDCHGWKNGDPLYEALKEICKERVEQIKAAERAEMIRVADEEMKAVIAEGIE